MTNQGILENNNGERCGAVRTMAERELSAFRSAVTRIFGAEQAERSTHDWLRELQTTRRPPTSEKEWRQITISASARLAEAEAISPVAR